MKIVIAGCGKIGRSIIKYLCNEGHSISVIDKDKELINDIINSFDVGGIVGSSTSIETLKEANVQKCDIFMAVSGNDEVNFISGNIAKVLGAKKTIVRVRDTDYTEQAELMKEAFEVDMIMNPELAVAEDLFYRLRFPNSNDVCSFEKGKVVSVEVEIPKESTIINKSIVEIIKSFESKIIIGAIRRGDSLEIPNGESVINAGDVVNIISTPEDIDVTFKKMGIVNQRIKSVIIIGGSRTAYHLAKMLTTVGVSVKIIEESDERCKQLIAKLDSSVEIVHADGSNEQILAEERLESYGACLTLTGLDEENIIISLFAKSNNVKTVITKINNDRLDEILDKLDLDAKISPKRVTVNQIIQFIRSIRAKEENTIEQLRKIMNDKLEILEFNVNNNKDFVGKAIKDLKIKSGVLIACIVRDGKVIVPNGESIIGGDDKVIILTKYSMKSLERILR